MLFRLFKVVTVVYHRFTGAVGVFIGDFYTKSIFCSKFAESEGNFDNFYPIKLSIL